MEVDRPGTAVRPSRLGDALLVATDAFRAVVASAAGYRAICLEHGFTPEAAEQMAVDYHRTLLAHTRPPTA